MSQEAYLLRQMSNGTKEFKVTNLAVTSTAAAFTSQLAEGYSRKYLSFYNNSNAASGECYYGNSDVSATGVGMPIPKGAMIEIPISDDLDSTLYFACESGELADLRVIEVA